MIKVLHLMSTNAFSGAENVACQIINGLYNDPNYETIYVSEIGENKKSLDDRNIKYYNLKKFNYININKAINDIKPDIIHAHDVKASIIASLFCKKAKIVSHIHSNHPDMRSICIKTLLYNICSTKFYKIIWVSQSALNNYKFRNNVKEKSIVLYNVINSKEIIEKSKCDKIYCDKYDIIYLGRLSEEKNPMRMIKIVKSIIMNNRDIKVAIVGDGKYYDEIKNFVVENKIDENVTLFGFQLNPYRILGNSKILIMTSIREGTPMCALEAIALGIPIISTRTDGLIEIVKNGETGFLVDKDEEFIYKISNLLKDKGKLQEMHNNVLNYNKEVNNMNNFINNIKQIYNR